MPWTDQPAEVCVTNDTLQMKHALPVTLSKWSTRYQWHSPNEARVTSDTLQMKHALQVTLSKWSMRYQWHSPNEACVTSDTLQMKHALPGTLSKWSMCYQWHSPNEACVTSDTLQTAVDWSKLHCLDGGKTEEEKHLAIRFNPKLSTAVHTAQNEKFWHQCKSSVNCPDSVDRDEAVKRFSFTSVWDLWTAVCLHQHPFFKWHLQSRPSVPLHFLQVPKHDWEGTSESTWPGTKLGSLLPFSQERWHNQEQKLAVFYPFHKRGGSPSPISHERWHNQEQKLAVFYPFRRRGGIIRNKSWQSFTHFTREVT